MLTNAGPIAKDLLEKGGFKVEMVPLDFQAIVARRLRKTPAQDGGWNGWLGRYQKALVDTAFELEQEKAKERERRRSRGMGR